MSAQARLLRWLVITLCLALPGSAFAAGAVAVWNGGKEFVVAYNAPTVQEAANRAMSHCPCRPCSIVATFTEGCWRIEDRYHTTFSGTGRRSRVVSHEFRFVLTHSHSSYDEAEKAYRRQCKARYHDPLDNDCWPTLGGRTGCEGDGEQLYSSASRSTLHRACYR